MSMSIDLGSKIESDLHFMLQFAEKVGIIIDKEIIDYSLNHHCLSFTTADYGKDENFLENVIIELDEKNDRATVKRKTRHEYDFEMVGDHPITAYRRYAITVYQSMVEFQVKDNTMGVTIASVTQTIREDEMGGGDWFISLYETLDDFQNEEKIKFFPDRGNLQFDRVFTSIPDGYKITEGLESISVNDENFTKIKRI